MYCFDLSLIVVSTGEGNTRCSEKVLYTSSFTNLETYITDKFGISKQSYYITYNGKKIDSDEFGATDGTLHVAPRTLGGKGGFGSMLRAIGAQIEKTTNREACRDLSGRRLRDINEEQRLKNWIAQQAEREREAAERKKKKLERLCQEPNHDFKDEKYDESRSNMTEKMSSSIDQGFKASTSGTSNNLKRKSKDECINKPAVKKKKKKNLWIDSEGSDSSSDESTDNRTECDQNEKDSSKDVDVATSSEIKS